MRLKVILTAALLLVSTVSLYAQDAAMMEAMMKAGTPGDPHKKLEPFVGTWTTKVTFWMAPGGPPMSSQGVSENRWIMGGRYLEQRFKGDMMGTPFEGLGYTGYDNVKKQYFGTWIDSMSTGMMLSTGWMPDGKTWLFSGAMADPMTGKDSRVEERITVVDDDHHVMEMWAPGPDGTMYRNMEIQYTRKK